MENGKKIAFIKTGRFSNINSILSDVLKKEFFDYHVDIIDINTDVMDCRHPINLMACMKTYGVDIMLGTKKLRACLMRTPYMFSKVRSLAAKRLKRANYSFTFQTQSIFDASIPGVPHFVYTDHTHRANLYYPAFDKKLLYADSWIALEREIYRNASIVFTMSSNISTSLVEQYHCKPEKVATVYCGSNVDIDRQKDMGEKRYSAKNILFVGVDWARKGGPQLLEAFKLILKRHPDARLTVVGCAPAITAPNCHVVGKVPLSEVGQYYQKASVFCLPTKLEPFGIVFIEAFAHKLPIVATTIGALPDIVSHGENGYLVDGNDIQQLAQRLIELVGDPELCKKFGQNGYSSIKEKYSWEKTGQRMKQHIDDFLKKQETY